MRYLHVLLAFVLGTSLVLAQVDSPLNIPIQDEGVAQGAARTLNCTGTGITCTVSGSTGALNVSGGGGGGNFLDVTITIDGISSDLTSWSISDVSSSLDNPSDLIWVDACSRFIGVTSTGTSSVQSADGIFWFTVGTIPTTGGPQWNALAYAPSLNRLVLVGNNNETAYSDTCGVTWTAGTPSEDNVWQDVVWSADLSLFAAVSSTGVNRVMTSADGITWTAQAAANAFTWVDIDWSPTLGLFAAVSSTGATNRAMTSPDGIAWTAQALSSTPGWNALTWSADLALFVAVASSSTTRVATSADGITWNLQSVTSGSWSRVQWYSEIGLLLAGGSGTSNNSLFMTSADGISWTLFNPGDIPFATLVGGPIAFSPRLRRVVSLREINLGTAGVAMSANVAAEGLVYTTTVTDQSWVTSSSRILCSPFGSTTDGLTPETVFASGVQAVTSNLVVGTGFDLSVYTPHGATGTYRFHCTGS